MTKYQKGLVSVVIPTYRRSSTLVRAIKSVINQTYQSIEILVVDDNEPDDDYSKEVQDVVCNLGYSQVKLVTQPHHINGAAARNAGIKVAKGEFISFLDDDDMWYPTKVEYQVETLRQKGEEVGGVSCRKVFVDKGQITHLSECWETKKSQSLDVIAKKQNIQTCTLLLRRVCLDETGYFDEHLRRHQEVQLMAFFTAKFRVDCMDEVLTIIDASDISNRPSYDKLLGFKKDFFKSVEPLLKNHSKVERDYIYKSHMTELAWVMYRDISKWRGILLLLKCFSNPLVLKDFVLRYVERRHSFQRVQNFQGGSEVLSIVNNR